MKKIAIITCGREPNYGACLQALATQKKVAELGYEAELMNYSFMDEKSYLPFRQKSLRSFASVMLFYSLRKSLHIAFERFRNKYMKYNDEKLYTSFDFRRICSEYDAFMVGSDQVWNPDLGIDVDITLLRFYESGPRRLSYASSFGVTSLAEQMKPIYRDALSQFESISTREVSNKQLVKELTNRDSVVSLDPTMLLTADEWRPYEEKSEIDEPYVLIYDMRHSPMVMETAKKLAEQKGCQVVALSRIVIRDKKIRTLYGVSPGQFLYLIKNAAAVVTDSFHGTVFSITYQKEFYSYCSAQGMKIGSRITDILSLLGLENRLIHDDIKPKFSSIDYGGVIHLLNQMRTVSLNYLKKMLAGEEITQSDCVTSLWREKAKPLFHVGQKSKAACCGCGACAAICPVNAINMNADDDGFVHPVVDEKRCIHCQKCSQACAFDKAFNGGGDFHNPLQAYIARSTDDAILKISASGGLFTLLSDVVLSDGGSVFGAIYENNAVRHVCAHSKEDRDRMRGSKYVQSDTSQIFGAVLNELQAGKRVLFTGTPCQNLALSSYLAEKDADCSNLILCDIICHGVSSPAVWEKYLAFVGSKVQNIISVNTRDKKYGSGYNMTICGEAATYHKNGSDDPFICLYQKNLPLRTSCFACPMKRLERVSDITIGDFQKAKTYFPEYADQKGVSVVFINTPKGESYWNIIKSKLDYKQSTIEAAMQVNLYKQIESSAERNRFFEKFHNLGFITLLKQYTTLGAKNKIKYNVKQIIKKCIGR